MSSRHLMLLSIAVLATSLTLGAQQPEMKEKFTQAQKGNAAALRQYTWTSRTEVRLKGETKQVKMEQVRYDTQGKLEKTPVGPPPEQQDEPGGLKGRIVKKKKEEMADLMQNLVALVTSYAHLPPEQMQAFIKNASFSMGQPPYQGTLKVSGQNAVQADDAMSIWIDKETLMMRHVEIETALEKKPVQVAVDFQSLPNGPTYQSSATLDYPDKNLRVVVENSGYQPLGPAPGPAAQTQPSQQPPAGQQLSPEALDKLLAPIALYPDALIAQMLMCSTSPYQVTQLSVWLKKNPDLKGTAAQEAAQAEGFDPSYAALTVFPQVIHMMAEQSDWTRQLGQAMTSDRKAVFASVQRLRAQAQAVGNLKSTPQQEVKTETTQSGQQVIVIQPTNPEVVYVPQYNPQVVYVTAPPTTTTVVVTSSGPPPGTGVIAFTAGIIIGAAASNNYYWGPYGWRGGAYMNEEAWEDFYEHRENMANDYYEHREDMAGQRGDNVDKRQEERTDRTENRGEDRTGRQEGRQENQGARQEDRTGRQDSRQQGAQTQSGAGRGSSASTYESRGRGQGGGQASQQRSGKSSGAFSGYEKGSSTRAASSRGRSSTSSSKSGGRSRKR